jgi:hypothetical protein
MIGAKIKVLYEELAQIVCILRNIRIKLKIKLCIIFNL